VLAHTIGSEGERETTIEFMDLYGRTHRTNLVSSACPDVGEELPVIYDCHHPTFVIGRDALSWYSIGGMACLTAGCMALVIALILIGLVVS